MPALPLFCIPYCPPAGYSGRATASRKTFPVPYRLLNRAAARHHYIYHLALDIRARGTSGRWAWAVVNHFHDGEAVPGTWSLPSYTRAARATARCGALSPRPQPAHCAAYMPFGQKPLFAATPATTAPFYNLPTCRDAAPHKRAGRQGRLWGANCKHAQAQPFRNDVGRFEGFQRWGWTSGQQGTP